MRRINKLSNLTQCQRKIYFTDIIIKAIHRHLWNTSLPSSQAPQPPVDTLDSPSARPDYQDPSFLMTHRSQKKGLTPYSPTWKDASCEINREIKQIIVRYFVTYLVCISYFIECLTDFRWIQKIRQARSKSKLWRKGTLICLQ